MIKEELVRLTGDHFKAIILNQFIYWSRRVRDFDRFLAEEDARMREVGRRVNVRPTNGWIYKSSEELSEETLLGLSHQTMGRHVQALVDRGYLLWRHNPEHSWDRTKQYRVDFVTLQQDLNDLGYPLDGFRLREASFEDVDNASSKLDNALSRSNDGESNLDIRTSTVDNRSVKNGQAIPEITTEINDDDVEDVARTRVQKIARLTGRPGRQDNPNNHTGSTSKANECLSSFRAINEAFSESTVQSEEHGDISTQTLSGDTTEPPKVDPYTAIDARMQRHLGRTYTAKEKDYRLIRQLLDSGVSLDFILAGIDYTFSISKEKKINSFAYCAEVIKQRYVLELTKHAEVSPISWDEVVTTTRHKEMSRESENARRRNRVAPRSNSTRAAATRDERYKAFYDLFPDS